MKDAIKNFEKEKKENIELLGKSIDLRKKGIDFMVDAEEHKYHYNFSWMGRPIIQYPQDMVAMQELIWKIKPDVIIETGIAHGGSLIYYASILELMGHGEVIGIDIDIREHNRTEIEKHPMYKRIKMIQGSSVSNSIVDQVKELVEDKNKIMVCLDSNHTHEHVLKELNMYSGFVSVGSYLVVFDTVIDDFPSEFFKNRPWDGVKNPKTAMKEFLKSNSDFVIDEDIDNKIIISVAPSGYLKRIK